MSPTALTLYLPLWSSGQLLMETDAVTGQAARTQSPSAKAQPKAAYSHPGMCDKDQGARGQFGDLSAL